MWDGKFAIAKTNECLYNIKHKNEHTFEKKEREKWWTSKKEHPTEKQYEYIARVAPIADCSI